MKTRTTAQEPGVRWRRAAGELRRRRVPAIDGSDWERIERAVFAEIDEKEPAPSGTLVPRLRRIVAFVRGLPPAAWAPAGIALAALLVALAAGTWINGAWRGGRVERKSGVACRAAEGSWRTPGELRQVKTGDTFRTDARGYLKGRLQRDAVVLLQANSEMTVQALEQRRVVIFLRRGSLAVALDRRTTRRTFAVRTPNAECLALGTVFQVEVFGSPGEEVTTVLTVERGTVRMLDKDGVREEAVAGAMSRVAMVGDSVGAVTPVVEPRIMGSMMEPQSVQPPVRPGSAGPAGYVLVRSAPAGGICTVDGVLQGITPLTIKVAPGIRRISVAWDRGRVWTQDTTVAAGDTVHLLAQTAASPAPAPDARPAVAPPGAAPDASQGVSPADRSDSAQGTPTDSVAAKPAARAAPATKPVASTPPTVQRIGTRSAVSGSGRRISGYVQPAILRLPGSGNQNPWSGDQCADVAKFATANSDLEVDPYWPSVSFDGIHHRFDTWQRSALRRGGTMRRELSTLTPEEDGLDLLADAVACVGDRRFEEYRSRMRTLWVSFLNGRFGVRLNVDSSWTAPLRKAGILAAWEEGYLTEAEHSYRVSQTAPKPRGADVAGLYTYLRMCHLMRYPILFCEASGVAEALSEEHARPLRTYLDHGGAIYFTAGIDECWAARGIIRSILGETVRDSLGMLVLRRMQNSDRYLSGFEFTGPRPAIFHPWTCLPLIVPKPVDVEITVFGNRGQTVFTDTIRNLGVGSYDQRTTCYRWNCTDTRGGEVPSGYYVCRVEAELFRQTYPMRVSALRLLPPGRHPVFRSFFDVSDVPFAGQRSVEEMNLPYDEPGTYGVSKGQRLVICYSEAHNEMQLLRTEEGKGFGREAALRWLTNVIVHSLGEGSLARGGM